MVLPIFRVDHLSSFQPLCKCPHRQALRFVFWMILSLIISTVNASHYITLPLPSPIPAFSLLLAVSFPVLAPHPFKPSVAALHTLFGSSLQLTIVRTM